MYTSEFFSHNKLYLSVQRGFLLIAHLEVLRLTGLCCIESVHYGTDLRVFFGSLASTRLRGNSIKIRPQNSPIVQFDKLMRILKYSIGLLTRYILHVIYYFMIYMLWFNFILGLNFIFHCFKLIIIHYHTQKQWKIKFKPRTKLNHNICTYYFYYLQFKCLPKMRMERSCGKTHPLGEIDRVSY